MNNVTVRDVLYHRKDFVYVRGHEGTNPHALWIARIQELRAYDSTRAYARVLWMYHPEDLQRGVVCEGGALANDGGRQVYHGHFELIASNHSRYTCQGVRLHSLLISLRSGYNQSRQHHR